MAYWIVLINLFAVLLVEHYQENMKGVRVGSHKVCWIENG